MKQALRHEGLGGNGNTRTRQLAARREQLIAVAEQLFLQHGFANTSVNAIVREAGGSLATLYAEFGSKESLFESVLSERAAQYYPKHLEAPKQPLDAQAELRALATQKVKRMLSERSRRVSTCCARSTALPCLAQSVAGSGDARIARPHGSVSADTGGSWIADDRELTRSDAARCESIIALMQGQIVFSAACGGVISVRTRTTHVNDAVDAFWKMYGKSG